MKVLFNNAKFLIKNCYFRIESLTICQSDYWVFVGNNGSGKSLLAGILNKNKGGFPFLIGDYSNTFKQVFSLSFKYQQRILEAIFNSRNNDCISPDNFGLTARQIIGNWSEKTGFIAEIVEQLGIGSLLDRPFMQLSTGERRKVLLCQILASQPVVVH